MEHHLTIRQGPNRLAVFADIADQHDAGMRDPVPFSRRHMAVAPAEFAKQGGKAQLVFLGQFLTRKDHHQMVEPGPVNFPERGSVDRLGEIDICYPGAQRVIEFFGLH